ncbi:MAG: hypothetical protein AAF990_01310 [Bacteroidota bacterium]
MSTQKRKINDFKQWQLSRSEMYHYKGKANAHFIVNGIVFHDSISGQSSQVLRNLENGSELPETSTLPTATPFSRIFQRLRHRIGDLFK